MRIGFFTNHFEGTTGEYLARAAEEDGHVLIRFGFNSPRHLATQDSSPSLVALQREHDLDVIFFVDSAGPFWPRGFEHLNIPTLGYMIDVHQGGDFRMHCAQFFDHVFVCQKNYVDGFVRKGMTQSAWLPLACDPRLHDLEQVERTLDVAFVGQLGQKGSKRNKILTSVLPQFKTNDYARTYRPSEMAATYNQAKIVFNASLNSDLNMRVFEALASGALLITDRIDHGLPELFTEQEHYVGYSSIDEAIEKIRYYLAHDAERQQIAERGRQHVLQHHTYKHRWQVMMQAMATPTNVRAQIRTLTTQERARAYGSQYVYVGQPKAIFGLAREFGIQPFFATHLGRAYARQLNARIPLTPNALRARLNRS